MRFEAIDDVEPRAGRRGLPRRPRPCHGGVPRRRRSSSRCSLEGEAGVGKTEVARALAQALGARLIRLQCHEGIDLHHAVYDWDYQRQLLAIRAAEAGAQSRELFGREFLLRRPLLEALEADGDVVLLIDEVDRADDEFEAFLLEFLADFAVTIPELGTVTARRRPLVVLTSNRTRELHDALKRRCLYHWIDYPSRDREAEIVRARLPGVPEAVVERVCAAVARLRAEELYKVPGVGETITWARALLALGPDEELDATLGVALKVREDVERVREKGVLRVREPLGQGRRAAWRRAPRRRAARPGRHRVAAGADRDAARARRARRRGRAAGGASRARRGRRRLARAGVPRAAHDALLLARGPRAVRARVRGRVRREHDEAEAARAALGSIPGAVLPRVAVPTLAEDRDLPALLEPVPAAWSDEELLRDKDFAEYSDAERAAARRLLARLAAHGPTRVSRRTRPVRRRGHIPDLRATTRASLRQGGELLERRWRAPTRRPRRVVLVLDVSGSMAPYARLLLQYVQASVAARTRVEAFAFGTQLTRITHELGGRDPDAALRRAVRARDGLVGRNADRRVALDAQPRARPPDRARRVRRDPVRRLGPRRAGAAGRRARPPAPHGAPARLAQSARGRSALRAADARHARGDAASGPAAAGQ